MSNEILNLELNSILTSESVCTYNVPTESYNSDINFASLITSDTSNDITMGSLNYSNLMYGISNIPTGIVQNIYSNINDNLAIRNEVLSSINSSDSVSTTVDVTNSNLSEKEKIEDAVEKASKKYGIDANLIKAVIKTESNFNPNVVSSAGAKGLMQIMPSNFKNLGITNPFDIYQNVDGGTKLLKEYIDKYNGDIQMGLMAYNGGPTRMKNRGVTSIAHLYKMPKETQNYVKKVMNYYKGE